VIDFEIKNQGESMKKSVFVTGLFLIIGIVSIFAQTKEKTSTKSYEIVLQIVAANNTDVKDEIPKSLESVVKKIKSNYSYSNYRLAVNFIHRVSNNSKIESKSVLTELNKKSVFLDWGLYFKDESEQFYFDSFRCNINLPLELPNSSTIFEQISFANLGFRMGENSPTLIGNLFVSKTDSIPDEMFFFVLTVKPIN
jgi:hypothetical protein